MIYFHVVDFSTLQHKASHFSLSLFFFFDETNAFIYIKSKDLETSLKNLIKNLTKINTLISLSRLHSLM